MTRLDNIVKLIESLNTFVIFEIFQPKRPDLNDNDKLTLNFRRTTNDNNNAQQNLTYLSHFVHLLYVTELEFRSTFHFNRWEDIQFMLEACPNVIMLIISTSLLLLSKLIDNSSLNSLF
ncbi:unnamed protein product [Rotaria sp. Silwood1]|nr:unnamed protein product [Rotaria sp. Silwood1]